MKSPHAAFPTPQASAEGMRNEASVAMLRKAKSFQACQVQVNAPAGHAFGSGGAAFAESVSC